MREKPLKIIFLDIDGVLNNEKCFTSEVIDPLNKKAIHLLNELIKATDACIVISSTWRSSHPLSWIQLMMIRSGFDFPEKIIGATMDFSGKQNSSNIFYKNIKSEITLWLEQVKPDSFVVLDDENIEIENLVKTTFAKGLLPEHIEKAKDILNVL